MIDELSAWLNTQYVEQRSHQILRSDGGGLGYVDLTYVAVLTGFGLTRNTATLGIATYRFAQFFLPIFLGAVAYASLRIGPWKIEKRDRLSRLREMAKTEAAKGETKIDFALRWGRREPPADVIEAAEGAGFADAHAELTASELEARLGHLNGDETGGVKRSQEQDTTER